MKQKQLHGPGIRLKQYEITKLIGSGGYGKVYHGFDIHTGKEVAIKTVAMSTFKNHGGLVGKFHESEIQMMKMVNSEFVVKFIDEFKQNKHAYIIMEYCNEGDIESIWMENKQQIGENQALQYMKQIVLGMKDMHKLNIMHRDIKMKNILMHDNKIKLGDLGFKPLTLSIGMLGYMAPEVVQSKEYNSSADIFSLGCLLYQFIYGQLPFSDKNYQLFINESKNKKLNHSNKITKSTQELLDQMLKFDQQSRITWEELFNYFDNL